LILNTDLIPQDIEELDFPALEKIELRGKNGFFPAWLSKLPKLKEIEFGWEWQSALPAELVDLPHLTELEVTIRQPHEDEIEKILPALRLHRLALISLAVESTLWEVIAKCTRLRALYVSNVYSHLDTTTFDLPASWADLPRLLSLYIFSSNVSFSLPTEWQKMTRLKELSIYTTALQNFPFGAEILQNLTVLEMRNAKSIDFPAILAHCNPEKLAYLTWQNGNVQEIPAEIGKFTQLTTLHLGDNTFQKIPPEILHLEQLKFANLGDKNWLSFMVALKQASWDYDMRCFALALAQDEAEKIKQAPLKYWLQALEKDIEAYHIALNVPERLNQYAIKPLPTHEELKKAVFFLVGKPTMYHTKADFKKRMKARGLTLHPTFDNTVTHIIVGKNPVGKQANLQHIQGFFTFEQIVEWLANFETATFQDEPLETDEVDNLRLLLTSGNTASVMLALQMMLQGGIPEALYPTFFWLAFAVSDASKKLYGEVFTKHYPVFWQTSVDKYKRKMLATVLEDLIRQDALPTETLFMSILHDFSSQLKTFALHPFALKLGGEPAKFVIQSLLTQGVLNLQNSYLNVIPAEIAQFPAITHLKLWNTKPLHRGLAHLKHLPNLQTIEILQKNKSNIVARINKVMPHVKVL
jgi:hypothetical protein